MNNEAFYRAFVTGSQTFANLKRLEGSMSAAVAPSFTDDKPWPHRGWTCQFNTKEEGDAAQLAVRMFAGMGSDHLRYFLDIVASLEDVLNQLHKENAYFKLQKEDAEKRALMYRQDLASANRERAFLVDVFEAMTRAVADGGPIPDYIAAMVEARKKEADDKVAPSTQTAPYSYVAAAYGLEVAEGDTVDVNGRAGVVASGTAQTHYVHVRLEGETLTRAFHPGDVKVKSNTSEEQDD